MPKKAPFISIFNKPYAVKANSSPCRGTSEEFSNAVSDVHEYPPSVAKGPNL